MKSRSQIVYNIFSGNKIFKKKYNNFNVGFIGALDFHKGLDFFFECIKSINKKNKKIKFLIAGELTIKNAFLIKLLSMLGIKKNFNKEINNFKNNNHNCIFLGNISKLEKFYNKIDLIVFPSRMNALGRPIIEASYYGIPSIVTVKNPQKDTLIHGVTGIAISTNDPKTLKTNILNFYNDPSSLKILGSNAHDLYLKNFNPKINSSELLKIYENV